MCLLGDPKCINNFHSYKSAFPFLIPGAILRGLINKFVFLLAITCQPRTLKVQSSALKMRIFAYVFLFEKKQKITSLAWGSEPDGLDQKSLNLSLL